MSDLRALAAYFADEKNNVESDPELAAILRAVAPLDDIRPACPTCDGLARLERWSYDHDVSDIEPCPDCTDGRVPLARWIEQLIALPALVTDLADVLSRMVVGWEPRLGVDLAQHPDVQRVMADFRRWRQP